ncbi:MAG: polysaccharide biosynthesis C-terminal domain-containing protein, partial [Hyphomicrobiales bacterium]
LFVLVIGILARASLGPVESLLTMAHLQNYAAAVYGGTFLLNATLCFILIPIFGLMGAAVATAFSMVFEATALYWVTRRYLGLRVFIFSRQPADEPAA